MNLLKDIRDDIINTKIDISDILRKARVLASLLDHKEFEKWVLSELNGYSADDGNIPDYRNVNAINMGDFSGAFGSGLRNINFPTFNLPEYIQKFANETKIIQGVKAIESLVKGESNELVMNWPPEYTVVCQSKIYTGMTLYYARKVIAKNSMIQILDTIRNKLLDFILDLHKNNPNIDSEDTINKIPRKEINTAYKSHISGSYDSSKK